MKLTGKFKEYIADICIKIFQIVFAMLVVGMLLRDKFDNYIFAFGFLISVLMLTTAIFLYYNSTSKESG